jgi:hypothetical protein
MSRRRGDFSLLASLAAIRTEEPISITCFRCVTQAAMAGRRFQSPPLP